MYGFDSTNFAPSFSASSDLIPSSLLYPNWVCGGGVREPGTSDNGAEQRPDAICYRHCERSPERHPRHTHPCRCAASTSCEPAENR